MIPPFSKFFILIVCLTSIVLADDFKTPDGKEYKHAKVSRVEPDGIVIKFSGGIVKIPFTELSPEIQKKYGYDPKAARDFQQETYQADVLRARQSTEAREKRQQEPVSSQTASDTQFLAMQGIAKRVQDLLASEAPITQSTVMVPGKPALDGGYQIVILSSKPFVTPAANSVPASKDPRKAWMIVAAGAAAAYTKDSPLPIKAIAFGDAETLKERVYYTLDMAIARDMQQKLKSDSIDTDTAYSMINAGLTKKTPISDGSR
jgi:hypothetical protein